MLDFPKEFGFECQLSPFACFNPCCYTGNSVGSNQRRNRAGFIPL